MEKSIKPKEPFTMVHLQVIAASCLGAVFELYDFSLYVTMVPHIAKHFYSSLPAGSSFLMALITLAAGYILRPFGAIVFGYLGDKIGRKHAFLITIILMGGSTFLVGVMPTYNAVGIAAPIILLLLRSLQGLALGGEYGGAVTYVAEHAPKNKRGFYTSFIQSCGFAGLLLSTVTVSIIETFMKLEDFEAWGWRIPFLISVILLFISIFIRAKLDETPIFAEMKRQGAKSKAPLKEAFSNWPNIKLMVLSVVGVMAGEAAIMFASHVYTFYFLTQTLKIDGITGNYMFAVTLTFDIFAIIFFGWISDKIGRKPFIMIGCALGAICIYPIFLGFTHFGNPALEKAINRSPVTLFSDSYDCSFQLVPSELKQHIKFSSTCDVVKNLLNKYSVSYANEPANGDGRITVKVGKMIITSEDMRNLTTDKIKLSQKNFTGTIQQAILNAGYPTRADPKQVNVVMIMVLWITLGSFSGMLWGSLAAFLIEMFPARIRYTSLSLPFHIGVGWVGGFMPTIAHAIVLENGNIYAGLWYPIILGGITCVIGTIFVKETKDVDITK